MIVWILTGNEIIIFFIAAGLIRLHMPGVKYSRVWRRVLVTITPHPTPTPTPYPTPCLSLTQFMGDSTNDCCQKQRHNCQFGSQIHSKYVYSGRNISNAFKHAVTNRGKRETALASSTILSFYEEISNIQGVKWKCHIVIEKTIKTDLSV